MSLLLVFLGGGLGALSRYALTTAISHWLGIRFPAGILTCNLLGCLLIGLAVGYAAAHKVVPDWFGPFLIVGFLGGFTTFSTFASDSLALFREGQQAMGFGNVILSVLPGIFAVWAGLRLAGS